MGGAPVEALQAGGDEGARAPAASEAATRNDVVRPDVRGRAELPVHAPTSTARGNPTPTTATALPTTRFNAERQPTLIIYNSNRDHLHARSPIRNSGFFLPDLSQTLIPILPGGGAFGTLRPGISTRGNAI